MQQYAGVYLLQNYSTCLGFPSHPSSGALKTLTAASGTGHSNIATNFLQRGLIGPRWRKVVTRIRDMTCTRSCSYSFLYSWLSHVGGRLLHRYVIWRVPEAAVTVLCTPDDGCYGHPKHVE